MQAPSPLISIVTPVFNQAIYLAHAVQSVLDQDYANWELLVVADGPQPEVDAVMGRFNDPRIRYFAEKPHGGVGHTRNYALQRSLGDYWVFLDADDALPGGCLTRRLAAFSADPALRVVDGTVVLMDETMQREVARRSPNFAGDPLPGYFRLDPAVFIGVSAMVRRIPGEVILFDEDLTHNEDLLFYITVFSTWGGTYSFVGSEVLQYRQWSGSSMRNLRSLEKGYRAFYRRVSEDYLTSKPLERDELRRRIRSIMVRSYLKRFQLLSALRAGMERWQ